MANEDSIHITPGMTGQDLTNTDFMGGIGKTNLKRQHSGLLAIAGGSSALP